MNETDTVYRNNVVDSAGESRQDGRAIMAAGEEQNARFRRPDKAGVQIRRIHVLWLSAAGLGIEWVTTGCYLAFRGTSFDRR